MGGERGMRKERRKTRGKERMVKKSEEEEM